MDKGKDQIVAEKQKKLLNGDMSKNLYRDNRKKKKAIKNKTVLKISLTCGLKAKEKILRTCFLEHMLYSHDTTIYIHIHVET